MSYTKSTQNQIFKAIIAKTKLCETKKYEDLEKQDKREVRKKVEAWLKDKTIEMFFYKTADFEFLDEEDDKQGKSKENYEKHYSKRTQTLALETSLIKVMLNNETHFGKILNSNFKTSDQLDEQNANIILKELLLKLYPDNSEELIV